MAKKTSDSAMEDESDASVGSARPVRLRRGRKAKIVTKSRKSRRKATSAPGGIHQRANKRMAW
jgi:hypothetical protein